MDACEHRTPAVRSGAATTNLMRSSGVPCESALLRSKALGEVGVERTGPRAQQPRVAGCGVNLKRGERRDLQGLAAVDLDAQRGARRLLCETDGVGSVHYERLQRAALAGERREDDRVEGRCDRRATGTERVGRRARWRGDDDAVAGEREHR